ncbi:hypothetical protein NHX12_025212 [Muraenolepis orangiensis]|uniref:Uncharacterized protein n=1 Tax=Muraenolepis orangiensis TaxID=630683 RepID=A0A9Q0EPG7_9TELE|nr:hypothetical protein NHX12_025212 [Muraenolepis orangiensis]
MSTPRYPREMKSSLTPLFKYLSDKNYSKGLAPPTTRPGESTVQDLSLLYREVITPECQKVIERLGQIKGSACLPHFWLRDEILPEVSMLDSTIEFSQPQTETPDVPPLTEKHIGGASCLPDHSKRIPEMTGVEVALRSMEETSYSCLESNVPWESIVPDGTLGTSSQCSSSACESDKANSPLVPEGELSTQSMINTTQVVSVSEAEVASNRTFPSPQDVAKLPSPLPNTNVTMEMDGFGTKSDKSLLQNNTLEWTPTSRPGAGANLRDTFEIASHPTSSFPICSREDQRGGRDAQTLETHPAVLSTEPGGGANSPLVLVVDLPSQSMISRTQKGKGTKAEVASNTTFPSPQDAAELPSPLPNTNVTMEMDGFGSKSATNGRDDQSGVRDDQSGGRDDQSGGRDDQSGGRDDQSGGRGDQSGGRGDQSGGRGDQSPQDVPTELPSPISRPGARTNLQDTFERDSLHNSPSSLSCSQDNHTCGPSVTSTPMTEYNVLTLTETQTREVQKKLYNDGPSKLLPHTGPPATSSAPLAARFLRPPTQPISKLQRYNPAPSDAGRLEPRLLAVPKMRVKALAPLHEVGTKDITCPTQVAFWNRLANCPNCALLRRELEKKDAELRRLKKANCPNCALLRRELEKKDAELRRLKKANCPNCALLRRELEKKDAEFRRLKKGLQKPQ